MSSVLQTPEVSQLLGGDKVHRNLYPAPLVEAALRRGEAELAARGSLVAETGKRTGRSPKDKFTIKDASPKAKLRGVRLISRFRPISSMPCMSVCSTI